MEFVNVMEGLTEGCENPVGYKCFDVLEKEALADSTSSLPKESEELGINKYVKKGT